MERTSGSDQMSAKAAGNAASQTQTHTSVKKLIAFFCAWKVALLAIAAASPGPGYDTSTQLLLHHAGSTRETYLAYIFDHIVSRLTRWDAIYFASSSEYGQIFEQEWAFSNSFARITSVLTRVLPVNLCSSAIVCHALAGILTSHFAHLVAVVVLYKLTLELLPSHHGWKGQIALTTACLHVISPAGVFLSAPYGESMFAATHFAGLLCYVLARKQGSTTEQAGPLKACMMTIMSGFLIGISAMIRSNGLLSGSIFAWDAITYIPQLPSMLSHRSWNQLLRLSGIILGGTLIAVGYILPQVEAYQEYCTLGNTRPWCEKAVPSIYTFVQSHYWNVGFLKYWTLSNIPLFAMAIPMLILLAMTGLDALQHCAVTKSQDGTTTERDLFRAIMARLALPQLMLTILATTSFHVQIINRISSGYPAWYIVLAIALLGAGKEEVISSMVEKALRRRSQLIVRTAVVYAVVQAGLYASFMPPA